MVHPAESVPGSLRVSGLCKSYGGRPALEDVSFSIHPREVLGLIGPNGAGKTTLFECLAGVMPADAGVLLRDGHVMGARERQSRELAATLRSHALRGRTLVLSIHQIAEAARLCDRFVLLHAGRVRAEGTLADLEAQAAVPRAASDLEEVFLALT